MTKDKILLTVSGGIDSVIMCHLFYEAKIHFGIAHCNFQLRGKESGGDEKFVEQLAKNYKVPFYVTRFDTDSFAREKNISVQMAARELRYKWFEEIRKKENYNYTATAHHKGDVIETMLINLIRGTGIRGLHGIIPKQNKIVRPLLFTSREEIAGYASLHKLSWREDSSNVCDKYIRNKLRLNIIPALKKINPSLENTLCETARQLQSTEDALKNVIAGAKKKLFEKHEKKISIEIKKLKQLQPVDFYLFELLKEYGFNSDTIHNIAASLDGKPGKKFYSDTHLLIKDREALILIKKSRALTKTFSFSKDIRKINDPLQIKMKKIVYMPQFEIPAGKNTACFDYDKLSANLSIRKWQYGDSFFPLGMKKKKKLSDFFTDNKFSLFEKEHTWLMLSGKDIIWVVGSRISDKYKISSDTKTILSCKITG